MIRAIKKHVWSISFVVGLALTSDTLLADNQEQASFSERLVESALERTQHLVVYEGSYRNIDYPMGDVPENIGVCTDVIVRSYRTLGLDLQQLVHEDMTAHFDEYPDIWGLTRPDTNIDHRRVLNLQVFFERAGAKLPPSNDPAVYLPGDIVTWMVPKYGGGTTPHIGVVTQVRRDDGEPLIVHHLSGKPLLEDVLFAWPITGHYRYQVTEDARDRDV